MRRSNTTLSQLFAFKESVKDRTELLEKTRDSLYHYKSEGRPNPSLPRLASTPLRLESCREATPNTSSYADEPLLV